MLYAEGLQQAVILLYVAIATAGEITALDIGPGQGITDPIYRIIICFSCSSCCFSFWQFGPYFRRSICQCTTDTGQCLEALRRINKDAYLCFEGLFHWVEKDKVAVSDKRSLVFSAVV